MAEAAYFISSKDHRLGGLSLICLAVAVVGPRVGANAVVIAISFRAVFLVVALVLGILGRRSRTGQWGMIGSGVTLAIMVIMTAFLVSRPAIAPVTQPTLPAPAGAAAP